LIHKYGETTNVFKYDTDQKLVKVDKYPEDVNEPVIGEVLSDIPHMTLDEYGLEGYKIYKIGINDYLVKDGDGKVISTYLIPDFDFPFNTLYVGHHFIYQFKLASPVDSLVYDYFDGNQKWILETHAIDLLTGEDKLLEFPYLIENISAIKDRDNLRKLLMVYVQPIRENKTLGYSEGYIADENLNFIERVDDFPLKGLVKLHEYYFNYLTDTFYDKDLNIIGIIDTEVFGFEVLPQVPYISLRSHSTNKYGLLDMNLEVVMPVIYDRISYFVSDEKILCRRDGIAYLYDLKTKEELEIPNFFNMVNELLYLTGSEASNSIEIRQGNNILYKYDFAQTTTNASFDTYNLNYLHVPQKLFSTLMIYDERGTQVINTFKTFVSDQTLPGSLFFYH